MPLIHNLRRDPFERCTIPNFAVGSPDWFMQFYAREFWRFIFVHCKMVDLAKTAIEFPPMQKGASFDLKAVEARIESAVRARCGRPDGGLR